MSWIRGISFKLFIICFVFVISSVLVVSALSYRYIKNETHENQYYFTNEMLYKIEEYLNLYYVLGQNTLITVSSALNNRDGDVSIVQSQLEKLYEVNSRYINNIYIIKQDLSIIGGSPITKVLNDPLPERKALLEQAYNHPYVITASEPYQSTFSGWTITITRLIPWQDDFAVVAIDLDLHTLEEQLLQISRNDEFEIGIMDQAGQLIAWNSFLDYRIKMINHRLIMDDKDLQDAILDSQKVVPLSVNGSSITIMKSRMSHLNWIIFIVLNETRLSKALDRLETNFVGLVCIGFLLSLVTSVFIARFIRNPVYYLIKKMRQVQGGNLNVIVTNHRKDEFGELSSSFEEMLSQLRQLIENLNLSEQMKRNMEIQVLQSQINPHFLYNTLGSINNVVELGRFEEVDPLISSLISILEYGIGDFSDKVTLQEEIDNVKHYLLIQNIRYDQPFEIQVHVADEFLDYPLLRMILQPIVENSFFHGYCGGRIAGAIRILAYRKEGLLIIEVIDNGVGMSEEKVQTLLAPTSEFIYISDRKRIGLYNIHKRIQLYFGDSYGLEVHSKVGEGTRVLLQFPEIGGGSSHENIYMYNR